MQTEEMPSEIKKAPTGVAFELYFKEPSKDAIKSPIQSPPKPSSLDEINKKLQDAQTRREQAEKERTDKLGKKDEEIAKKHANKEEEDNKFKKQSEEKISTKFKKSMEVQQAQEEARKIKQKELLDKLEKARAKKKLIGETEETNLPDMTRAQ